MANIEQYGMGEAYSNVSGSDSLSGVGAICVGKTPVYGVPATYLALKATKKGREKIQNNRLICEARKSDKSSVPSESVVSTPSSDTTTPSSPTKKTLNETQGGEKSKTGLYIGIGVFVVLAITTIVIIRRRKK